MQRVSATRSRAVWRPPPAAARAPRSDLRKLVVATPDLTLAELQAELQRRCGVRAGLSTIPNALRGLGLRHKKEPEGGRAGPPRRRRQAPALARLAALHGSGALRLPRRDRHRPRHDPALRPQPARRALGRGRAARPLAHHDLDRRAQADPVAAPLVLDGPITGVAFRAYVEQFLAPDLAPGDVVVLDNLAAHKVDGVRQALAAAGASLLYCRRARPT
jgi:hypothetical protein